MAYFIDSAGKSYTLDAGKQVLGHAVDADLTLPQQADIAPHHAEVRPLLGGFVVKHLGGDNHQTLVNGDPVKSCKTLSVGDVLILGSLKLTYVLEPPETEPVAALEPDAELVEVPPMAPTPMPPEMASVPIELPPLPANLVGVAPALAGPPAPVETVPAGVTAPPPLPMNLSTSSEPPVELPPLPANLASAEPAIASKPEIDPLPTQETNEPVMPVLASNLPALASPPAGIPAIAELPPLDQLPPLGEIRKPEPALEPGSTLEPIASPLPPADVVESSKISQKIQLSAPERKKRSPWKENLIAIAATLAVITSGLVILKKRSDRLKGVEGEAKLAAARVDEAGIVGEQPAVAAVSTEATAPWVEPFEDPQLNYRFYTPEEGWKPTGNDVFSSNASIALTSANNRCRFVLFADAVGDGEGASESELIAQSKHRLSVAAQTMNFKTPTAETIAGRRFYRCDATGVMGTSHYFVNLTLQHQGYFYHLVSLGEIAHESTIKETAIMMAERLELIDPSRQLSLSPQHTVRGFRDAYHGYAVNLDRIGWALWKKRALRFPQAQFAALSHNGLPFGIVPVRFQEKRPNLEEFTAAMLAGLGLSYPNPEFSTKAFTHEGKEGLALSIQTGDKGKERSYYLRVLLGNDVGYLLGGWGPGHGDYHSRTLAEAMQSVEFFEPETTVPERVLSDEQRAGQRQIYYQLGVQRLLKGDVLAALGQFRHVVDRDVSAVEMAIPLAEAFVAAGQPSDGLAFLQQWQAKRDAPQVNAALALMQCSSGDWDGGQARLREAYAKGLADDLILARYLDRVSEPVQARALVAGFDRIRCVGRDQLCAAAAENRAGRPDDALSILNPIRAAHPRVHLLLKETITARIGLKQPDTALALARSVGVTSLIAYLKGHRQRCLGNLQEAKAHLRTAVHLAPNDPFYLTELLAVHADTQSAPKAPGPTIPAVIAPDGTFVQRVLHLRADGDLEVFDTAHFAGVASAKFWQLFETLRHEERLERLSHMLPMPHHMELSEASFDHLAIDDGERAMVSLHYTVRGAFRIEDGAVRGKLEFPLESMILADEEILGGDQLVGSAEMTLPTGWRLVAGWDDDVPTETSSPWSVQPRENAAGQMAMGYQVSFARDESAGQALLAYLGTTLTFERAAVAMRSEDDQE